jgi:peptidoglycan/LPS O-acetylase OafA/YrhL
MVTSGMLPKTAGGLFALRWISGIAGLSLAALLMFAPSNGPSIFYGTYALAGVLTAALIAGLVAAPPDLLTAALSWKPLAWTGRISYGLYLFHVPIYCLLPAPPPFLPSIVGISLVIAASIGLSFAAAAASFYLVERHFLALKDRVAGVRIVSLPANVPAAI